MVLSTTAVAQPDKDWWACQVVHSSGMDWENNRWVTRTFEDSLAFVLMSDGNGSLTTESVAEVLESRSAICGFYAPAISCHDGSWKQSVLLSRNRQGRHQQSLGFNHAENRLGIGQSLRVHQGLTTQPQAGLSHLPECWL